MHKTFEIELRGPLNLDEYQLLRCFLEKEGKFITERNRFFIDYSTFLPDEGIKERKRDIRIRVTNKKPEIIIKTGGWGGSDQREEISIFTEEGSFDKLVKAFHILGYSKGIFAIRNSIVYTYKGIEFALVEVPNHSYYFEAEKLVEEENKQVTFKEIEAVCHDLNLTLFNDQKFFEYIDILNKEANEVFDFKNYTPDYFKNRFNL